ncbi:MAG: Ig-like domain-containing protein [Ruminococcaceae bacterium]|nr:Ig-like domain-containing protein [Oscillospiraceae bacterium]
MRRLLSVVLAIVMVMSTVAFAIPSAVTNTDNAEEQTNAPEENAVAELTAAKALKRGINMLTGNKNAFDGETETDISWATAGSIPASDLAVVDDPTGERGGKVFQATQAVNDKGYPNFNMQFGGDLDTDIGHTYLYVAFDYQKYVPETEGYIENTAFWVLNSTAAAGTFAVFNPALGANEGWKHFGKIIDYTINTTGDSMYDTTTNEYYTDQDLNKSMVFQSGKNTANTVPAYLLFDDIIVAPAYKVTYYNKAGTDVVKTDYIAVDEEGNLLEAFEPAAIISGSTVYSDWSLTQGGSVKSYITLDESFNEDIVLYATTEGDATATAKVVLDNKLTKAGDTAVATAKFLGDPVFDPFSITWSSAHPAVAEVSYDKATGIATVTAKSEGYADLTFSSGSLTFTDRIYVTDDPIVASSVTSGAEISEFAGVDLELYEYVTVNVTNTSSSAKKVTVSLDSAELDNEIGFNFAEWDIEVPANVTNYDVYVDLTNEALWKDDSESITVTAQSGVTINNAKLWPVLTPEIELGLTSPTDLISTANGTVTVTGAFTCDLEGVYDETFTLTVDTDPTIASYTISGNNVTVKAGTAGTCVVTVTATSNEDPSVKAVKKILVDIGNTSGYGLTLDADSTSINGDAIATITPIVHSASGSVDNFSIEYAMSADGYASLLKNGDGTATVTPLKDGSVTITATAVVGGNTLTDDITLTLTNIPRRTVAYDLKLMLIGNSYLEHGYLATADKTLYNGYMDKTDVPRGMAATSPELDYYAQLCKRLEAGFEGSFTSKKQGGAVIEQAWKKGLASGTPSDLTGWDPDVSLAAMQNAWAPIVDYMDKEQPNLITIQLAENAAHAKEESATFFYDEVCKMIDAHRPENSVVVIISPMGTQVSSNVQQVIAAKYGFYWADNTWIGDENGWGASNPYLAFGHYPDYTNSAVVEFRTHPGNLGMEEIAKSAYAIFEEKIPTAIKPTLVTLPDSFTIEGADTITAKGGTAQLTAVPNPASATDKVYWSVNNENLATVDENGLVTALLNGTVTVTAKSIYDEEVVATKTITISGQIPHYTLTYASGVAGGETVNNIPAAFAYAAGEYVFPALVAVPERNGYKFLGWSETEGGEVVKSVNMTSAKTVYAIWELADSWSFDNDGDLEGIGVAGFNTKVEGGVMSTISYDGQAVGFSDATLILDASKYSAFKTNISMSTVNSGDYFTLTITTDEGNKTFTAETLVGANDYTFDLSEVTGTITGFSLYTSNSADGVGMTVDYAKFVEAASRGEEVYDSLDVNSYTTLDASNNLITVNNLTVNSTLVLEPGSYVFENVSGTGKIEASVNANVLIKNGTKPTGYVEIEIGAKAENAIRYAEVDGAQYRIYEEEGNTKYGMILGDESKLLEITSVGSETASKYYLVKDGAGSEISMGTYANKADEKTIRNDEVTSNRTGARFAASVSKNFENVSGITITEHGFIVGLEETINANGGQLNFDLKNEAFNDGRGAYVSGKAFVRDEYNMIANHDSYASDSAYVFAAILVGAPEAQYNKRLVIKTYTKLTINEEEFVVYGQPMVESFYSLAAKLKGDTTLPENVQTIINGIVENGENFGNEEALPGDDLWS